jgi:two-component sensor histidine kinase
VSGLFTDDVTAGWPLARAARPSRVGAAAPIARDAAFELGFRASVVRVGSWLGWASIVVVLAGLALDAGTRHRGLLLAFTLTAATANAAAMLVPWPRWLATRRGRILLDLWCLGLIAFVEVLVAAGGSNFALLLFLAIPFIAVVQTGWRRGFWLGASAGTCALAAALLPLSAGATAMRLALVFCAVGVALVLARTIRRETSAHERATASVQVERTLAREANHRIKNDLQTVADLLLLGRPAGTDGTVFDETAARIRSIATVHRLLTETEGRVDAGELLRSIAGNAPVPVRVEADACLLDAATAQKLGIVANELVTNAFRHGSPPVAVQLTTGLQTTLRVCDDGCDAEVAPGFGLDLVRRMVEQGLDGTFELRALPGGGTRADVVFPAVSP